MAKKVQKKNPHTKRSVLIGVIALAIMLPVALLATRQTTEVRQHASQFNDLNTASTISQTNNPDDTMGPSDYTSNFSNTFPNLYLGTLSFQVTDPVQEKRTTQAQGNTKPTFRERPSTMPPSNNSASSSENTTSTKGGPQTITSLILTINKVEVHLAHVGLPGTRNEDESPTPSPERNSQNRIPSRLNQTIDKWEVLNIGTPKTIDLVQLAKNNALASLGITKLVNGRYTELRLYVKAASATLADGTKVTLVIPGKGNVVRIVQSFVINSSKLTTITVDFDAQNSVIKAGNAYILKPVVAHMLEEDQQ